MKELNKEWHIGMRPGPIVYDEQGSMIADCRTETNTREANVANALRIVALPDLIQSSQNFIEWFKEFVGSETYKEINCTQLTELLEAIKATKG